LIQAGIESFIPDGVSILTCTQSKHPLIKLGDAFKPKITDQAGKIYLYTRTMRNR